VYNKLELSLNNFDLNNSDTINIINQCKLTIESLLRAEKDNEIKKITLSINNTPMHNRLKTFTKLITKNYTELPDRQNWNKWDTNIRIVASFYEDLFVGLN